MISVTEEYDAYIIVSFVNATLVLSIGETVEEVTDSGFLGTTPTLSCSALGEDALVQVHRILILNYVIYNSMHYGISSAWSTTRWSQKQCYIKVRRFASLEYTVTQRVLLVF